jgi:enoyl-CoA hydratase/carnithine racemase
MISGILSSNKNKMILVEEVDGEILIFTIHRPNVKNAVDRETSQELYKKFQFFENSKFKIAILRGSEGNFCSGADLKSLSKGEGNKLEIDTEEGPMGQLECFFQNQSLLALKDTPSLEDWSSHVGVIFG